MKTISRMAVALVLAEVALVLVSWLLSATMAGEGVRSLLSAEGVRWFFSHFSQGLSRPLLGWMFLLAMGWGCLRHSGVLRFGTADYRHRLALRVALLVIGVYVGVLLLLTLLPHAVLLSATGSLFPSPFSRALVPVVALGMVLAGIAYGLTSATFRTASDVFRSLSMGIVELAPLFVLYVLLIQFYDSLRFAFF